MSCWSRIYAHVTASPACALNSPLIRAGHDLAWTTDLLSRQIVSLRVFVQYEISISIKDGAERPRKVLGVSLLRFRAWIYPEPTAKTDLLYRNDFQFSTHPEGEQGLNKKQESNCGAERLR